MFNSNITPGYSQSFDFQFAIQIRQNLTSDQAKRQAAIQEINSGTQDKVNALLRPGLNSDQDQAALGVKSDASRIQDIGKNAIAGLVNSPANADAVPATSKPSTASARRSLALTKVAEAFELLAQG